MKLSELVAAASERPVPLFRLTGIHIKSLRSIRTLDWPKDGLGWNEDIPDVVVIGGVNGSGKTTLLRCLAHAARLLVSREEPMPEEVAAGQCQIDFLLSDGADPPIPLRFLSGDKAFVAANRNEACYGYVITKAGSRHVSEDTPRRLRKQLGAPKRFAASNWPRLAFFPSEERDLEIYVVKESRPKPLDDSGSFVMWWERSFQYDSTTMGLLFSARWADMNAKEEGKPEEATNFDRFTRAFIDLTEGKKQLGWTTKGALVVKLRNGTSHPVGDLSSGERQALFLLAELRRAWRPGSLILVDELELHLHDAWQGRLYEAICSMQKELGGQVLITTQSHSLFEMARLGTRALLGRGALR